MPNASLDQKRIIFPETLTKMGLLGEGAEVGVFTGWHARLILDNWPGKKLWGVDAYKPIPCIRDGHDVAHSSFTKGRWRNIKACAERETRPHKDRYELLHMNSYMASKHFKDGSLDWVYIDAGHHKEAISMDIDVWLPKVKDGGILAGHDYFDEDKLCRVEVKEVVDAFFGDRVKIWDTGEIPTWWVQL